MPGIKRELVNAKINLKKLSRNQYGKYERQVKKYKMVKKLKRRKGKE